MEKLVKPSEYAKELGISRQAVYAKIKRGILTAKDVEGKLYIVVDNEENRSQATGKSIPPKSTESAKTATLKLDKPVSKEFHEEYEALLLAKDETIAVLKSTVRDLKKSNKQITRTLKGEIDLLKEAFHEMRTLYMHQLEFQKPTEEAIDVLSEEAEEKRHWISVKKLFKKFGLNKTKQQEKFLKRLEKAWKSGDERIVKVEGKFRLDNSETYEDLLK